jgi:hypothetical protein
VAGCGLRAGSVVGGVCLVTHAGAFIGVVFGNGKAVKDAGSRGRSHEPAGENVWQAMSGSIARLSFPLWGMRPSASSSAKEAGLW